MSKADNILTNTDERLFLISDDIDNTSIGKICFNILYLLQEDEKKDEKEKDYKREPIKIYVNSGGGEVYDMWALIDILEGSKTPIYTYCTGYAMSAAFKIFLAGHKRFASKHATFMYHNMTCWRHGTYQDLVEDRAEMDILNEWNEEYVLSKTKIEKSKIEEVRKKKQIWYIHADEAVKLGIIDEII